jgi:hypothetical protein
MTTPIGTSVQCLYHTLANRGEEQLTKQTVAAIIEDDFAE